MEIAVEYMMGLEYFVCFPSQHFFSHVRMELLISTVWSNCVLLKGITWYCRFKLNPGPFSSEFDALSTITSPHTLGLEYEPRREKTGLRGFRPGQTQTGLYKLRKELEA